MSSNNPVVYKIAGRRPNFTLHRTLFTTIKTLGMNARLCIRLFAYAAIHKVLVTYTHIRLVIL